MSFYVDEDRKMQKKNYKDRSKCKNELKIKRSILTKPVRGGNLF